MRTLIMILAALTLASCSQADADVLSPSNNGSGTTTPPVVQPPPIPPVPATPNITVRLKQIVFGTLPFQGPSDAWHAIFEYDVEPDPLRPCLVVKTYYRWLGSNIFRENVKVWDCSAGHRIIVDDFWDCAWNEPVIEYSVQIFAASVSDADWYGGFCMGWVSDYWGGIDPNWLYCPIDGAHPNGLRVASALVTGMGAQPIQSKFIRVLGYAQVVVQ